jgi:hypothetical protein
MIRWQRLQSKKSMIAEEEEIALFMKNNVIYDVRWYNNHTTVVYQSQTTATCPAPMLGTRIKADPVIITTMTGKVIPMFEVKQGTFNYCRNRVH